MIRLGLIEPLGDGRLQVEFTLSAQPASKALWLTLNLPDDFRLIDLTATLQKHWEGHFNGAEYNLMLHKTS